MARRGYTQKLDVDADADDDADRGREHIFHMGENGSLPLATILNSLIREAFETTRSWHDSDM